MPQKEDNLVWIEARSLELLCSLPTLPPFEISLPALISQASVTHTAGDFSISLQVTDNGDAFLVNYGPISVIAF